LQKLQRNRAHFDIILLYMHLKTVRQRIHFLIRLVPSDNLDRTTCNSTDYPQYKFNGQRNTLYAVKNDRDSDFIAR
jgi:hypothetical protein